MNKIIDFLSRNVKTWMLEMFIVATVLFTVNVSIDKLFSPEIFGSIAVLLSFGHAQIADRLAEKENSKPVPDVECYQKLNYYFILKEIFWLIYFLFNQSYSALIGVFIFIFYPFWRKFYRNDFNFKGLL